MTVPLALAWRGKKEGGEGEEKLRFMHAIFLLIFVYIELTVLWFLIDLWLASGRIKYSSRRPAHVLHECICNQLITDCPA